ncbi:cache domain-containing sensor histidine kinase [Paenibacillus prosopidis]|uniref:Two-component system sensor histidine kinase YesM n=1 Tax=Paenibacillus prosopidis TaxID=630520 RepID=A0A368W211_9BACL|nr:sensor histidine kinase [Paenibacillus prosopidis]RCW48555.1 two-component system sensor histidine kinase YesM [Paenibacillus prosopidis]
MARFEKISNRFASKMILAFLLIILIPTTLSGFSFYLESSALVKRNVRASAVQVTKQTADALSSIFNAGSDTSDLIYGDLKVQDAAMHYTSSPLSTQVQMSQSIDTLLNNVVYSSSFVRIVYIFKDGGIGWGSGTFSAVKLRKVDLNRLDWVEQSRRQDGGLVWQALRKDPFSGGGENTDLVLPISRTLKDFESLEQIGLLVVSLNGKAIINTINQVKLGETGRYMVVDPSGQIMIDADLSRIGKMIEDPNLHELVVHNDAVEFEYANNGVHYYGVKQLLSNGWLLVGTVPTVEITGALDKLHTRILITSACFALLAVLIGLLIAKRVTKPIKQLTLEMKRVQQGDLSVRTVLTSTDEIGLMSKHFNKMLDEIEQLMERVEKEQNDKLEAEVRAVTYRIHPHFLYNTLSTLRWLIRAGEKERAEQGLAALTRLLEANMGKNGQMITLKEELEIIQKYIVILEMRYEHKYALSIDVQPGAEEIKIPRMLLQPLVENAIFHGFVPLNRGGDISIHVTMQQGLLHILLQDNGAGMTAEKLEQLGTKDGVSNRGIGLQHVYDSLRLYFGVGSGMTFDSEIGKGTQIHIVIRL